MSDAREAPPALDLKASLKRPLQAALAAGVATALLTLLMPNYYRSESRLLPVDPSGGGNLGNLAAAAAAFGVGIGGNGGSDANFVDVLNSRWMLESLLRTEFSFHQRTWRFGEDRPVKQTLYAYLDKANMDRAVKALDGMINASKDLKTNVITLTAETKSPELSQAVVRRAIELLNQFEVDNSRTRGTEKAAFAEARLADARREMDRAEAEFMKFLEVNRNYQGSPDPAIRLHGARLEAELNLRRQLVTTLSLNREQALLDAKNDIPILNVLDPGNLPIDKSKPSRSVIVILAALVAGLGMWGWQNRDWIRERLLAEDEEPIPSEEQIR